MTRRNLYNTTLSIDDDKSWDIEDIILTKRDLSIICRLRISDLETFSCFHNLCQKSRTTRSSFMSKEPGGSSVTRPNPDMKTKFANPVISTKHFSIKIITVIKRIALFGTILIFKPSFMDIFYSSLSSLS